MLILNNNKNKLWLLLLRSIAIVSLVGLSFFAGHQKATKEKESTALSDWEVLQMAIVMTESNFDPEAVGKDGDWGIFQITSIYSKEVNRILEAKAYSHEDAFDIQKSIEMFNILQDYYNPDKDVDKAIKYHNKAPWYRKKVKDNIQVITRMEEVRRALKKTC